MRSLRVVVVALSFLMATGLHMYGLSPLLSITVGVAIPSIIFIVGLKIQDKYSE